MLALPYLLVLENVGYVHELITERSSHMFGAGAVFCDTARIYCIPHIKNLKHLIWL